MFVCTWVSFLISPWFHFFSCMVHRLDPSVSVEQRWLKQTSYPWSGSQEASMHSDSTRCDVTRAGCFSGMFFTTTTTIPSILSWLTVFIDLVIYLFVMNGSWRVSNAFSLSVKMTGGFRPSLYQYAVSHNWSWVLVQYCNPGRDLAQPFAKCFSIWFADTGWRVYASLFMTVMGL